MNAEDAGGADPEAAAAFHIGLLNRGIFIAPRGLMATSTVTEEQDVADAVEAARELFAALVVAVDGPVRSVTCREQPGRRAAFCETSGAAV